MIFMIHAILSQNFAVRILQISLDLKTEFRRRYPFLDVWPRSYADTSVTLRPTICDYTDRLKTRCKSNETVVAVRATFLFGRPPSTSRQNWTGPYMTPSGRIPKKVDETNPELL